MFKLACILNLWLLASLGLAAQTQTIAASGSPPMRLFLPGQYNANSQNFALTQDRRGVLYAGNFAGVLEYDGLEWRTIPTANITKVSALLTATRGTVYVGGNGEFGYLQPDTTGALRYRSLSEHRAGQPRRFGEVLAALEMPDGVYFVTRDYLFRWNGHTVKAWASPAPITAAFQQGGSVWVFQAKRGLIRFRQGAWQLAAGPALDDAVGLLPLPGGGKRVLVVTSHQGLFELTGTTLRAFASTANETLRTNQATGTVVLADGTLLVSTVHAGLLLLGADGRGNQLVPGTSGQGDQVVNALLTARDGSLWLALNNGLLQLELPTPITLFSAAAQQLGEVNDIQRIGKTLYVAAANGLFRQQGSGVQPVPGLSRSCFSLATMAGQVYTATSQGVYRLGSTGPEVLTSTYAICLAAARTGPARLYVGTQLGLSTLSVVPGQAPRYRAVAGINVPIVGIEEAPNGSVWLETLRDGLYRLLPNGQVRQYATRQGLPTLLYNRLAVVSNELLVYNDRGVFQYDAPTDHFKLRNPFGNHQVADNWKNTLVPGPARSVWTVGGDTKTITLYQPRQQGYAAVTLPFLPLSTAPINVIYPDTAGITWFGGRDGLARYDASVRKNYTQPYTALIRQVQVMGERLLYEGGPLPASLASPVLPAGTTDISFRFAAATYPVVPGLVFQYKLESYDRLWSDWTAASQKEYTNLPSGQYIFQVQARNIYGTRSQVASYAFEILAPWYTRWWALVLLATGVALVIFGLVRWRVATTMREKQALENLILERTEEVVSQKAELEKQSLELADKNDQLEKIDLIVQSINAEIDSDNLFQVVLAKFSVVRHLHGASFLVFDKAAEVFRFKALRGSGELSQVQDATLTLAQAESRFLAGATEVYEDIYLQNPTSYPRLGTSLDSLPTPRSLVTIVMENEGHIEGLITLENNARPDAFDQLDIDLIRNLKEHLIAAFIKTRLLESLATTLRDLESTQDELIRQEKLASVGQLTKGIVDRIINPLNYVTNFSQTSDEIIEGVVALLEEQQRVLPPAALAEILEELAMVRENSVKIQEHSHSTTRILKDMKRLLKEKSRDYTETDLNTLLSQRARAIVQEMQNQHPDLQLHLALDLAAEPLLVSLLPVEFGQVVRNLLSNSVYTLAEKSQYAPGFVPEIRIRTRLLAGQAVVQLRDNGKGVPTREQERLFSPFFTTKPTAKGSGLGLYMAKDIIEAHKGRIMLESREGEYTEITISLPVTLP
jgi:signal transduction histidine kinase/ligand-binding sensor domain-containing protein